LGEEVLVHHDKDDKSDHHDADAARKKRSNGALARQQSPEVIPLFILHAPSPMPNAFTLVLGQSFLL
jgi:hypothetical protein